MTEQQINEYSNRLENSASFAKRFYIYQKERFPFFGHGVMVAAFSFSAISYSRICRNAEGFVDTAVFLVGIATTISLFFLVRIFDEFKDAEDDALYRKHLPVPRGLISFSELAIMALVAVFAQIVVNYYFFPEMLMLYAVVMIYLLLMGKEFFIGAWLKNHHFFYVTSHMLIIPLIDVYASGLDWLLGGAEAPRGLIFFFLVSFMNGIVLEVGRKIRAQDNEEFNTYSTMMGAQRATILWQFILFFTFLFALLASWFAGHGLLGFVALTAIYLLCSLPAVLFYRHQTKRFSKWIEYASAVWTIGMYLSLGGIPMIKQLLSA